MKRTTKQPRKALTTPTRLGLLAAVSGFALVGAVSGLSAQSVSEAPSSGGYSTAGIPIGDDVYGAAANGLQPTGVGPAAAGPAGVQAVGSSRGLKLNAPVRRGRWVTSVTPFVEGSVTYSDNINLDSDGNEEDETVLTATAGVTFAAQNERLAGQLSYQASYDTFLNDTNQDGFRHNLNTNWSASVVRNLFYIDVAGGVAESYNTGDRISGNTVANSDDRERVYYGLISPSLQRNLGGWANAEVRYTARGEFFEEDDNGGYSQTISAGLTGDPRKFRRFGWQAATEYEVYTPEDESDDDPTRWTSYASVDVPVARTLAVTGTLGYDHFSDDVADSEVSGVFANAGLRWQPNTRFAARAFGGWRYDGLDYGAEATYALRQNLVAGLQARRGVQFTNFRVDSASPVSLGTDANGRQAFLGADGGRTTNIDDALAVDNLTGNQGRFGDINRNDQDDDAIVDNLQAYIAGQHGRTAWNANVQAAHYDYGSTFGTDETIIAANAEVTRNLTSRLAASAGVGFTSVQFDDPAPGTALEEPDYETLSLGLGLEYQLTEIVNVFGRYTYTKRFADLPEDEFDENAGLVGVRASF